MDAIDSNENNTEIVKKSDYDNGILQCGICEQTFETGALKSSLKYGITSCEPCRNFINRMLRSSTSNSIRSFPMLTCKSQTGGNCELPPTTIKVGRKLVLNQTNLRCKACWLNSCIKNYNLPNHLKQQLTGVLLPKKAEDSSETFDEKASSGKSSENREEEKKINGDDEKDSCCFLNCENDTFRGFNVSDDNEANSDTEKTVDDDQTATRLPAAESSVPKEPENDKMVDNSDNNTKDSHVSSIVLVKEECPTTDTVESKLNEIFDNVKNDDDTKMNVDESDNQITANVIAKLEMEMKNDSSSTLSDGDSKIELNNKKLPPKRSSSIASEKKSLSLSRNTTTKNNNTKSITMNSSADFNDVDNNNVVTNEDGDLSARVKARKRKPNLHYVDEHTNDTSKKRRKAAINFMERMKIYAVDSLMDEKDTGDRNKLTLQQKEIQEKALVESSDRRISNSSQSRCNICGTDRGQMISKYGLRNCRACYSFISRIFVIPSQASKDSGYYPCSLYHGELGQCGVEIPLKYQNMTLGYPTRKRCKACWIAMFIAKCAMPFKKKQFLTTLIPKRMREATLKNVPAKELEEPLNEIIREIDRMNGGGKAVVIKYGTPWAEEIIKKMKERRKAQNKFSREVITAKS